MKRFLSVFAVLAAVVLGMSTIRFVASAQDDADMTGHPILGAWSFDSDVNDPENPRSVLVFFPNGVVSEVENESPTLGIWEPTAANTVAVTFRYEFADEEMGGEVGTFIIRATLEVSEDGQTLSATYTLEVRYPGMPEGEFGPGTGEGTRLTIEPMGEPVGTLEDLFGMFEETDDEAMPEATPED
ncbi:MAG: hypothetical protein AB7V46_24310 [Thermomicrobiales bacterium]